MSTSRRGLLAAGLAAAVVGTTGVVWTLNANAAEAPVASNPAVVSGSVADDAVAVPPKVLPWGARPSKIKRAKAGANSAAVAAADADAAPADTSGSMTPVAEYAPKGRTSATSTLTTEQTSVLPPDPPSDGGTAGKVYFHYAYGRQYGDTDGSWANLGIFKPELDTSDYHTLTEIAVQSTDGKQIVEVGWNVDRAVNGDTDPHLFVFYWKDRVPSCYNACGFVQYSKTTKPGDTLPAGDPKRFGIQHSDGKWWIAYNSEWIGYFPDSLWEGNYTRAGLVQWFGEVAASSTAPCTDMGNGELASEATSARVGSVAMTNGPAVDIQLKTKTASNNYTIAYKTDTTFRFGGPGDC